MSATTTTSMLLGKKKNDTVNDSPPDTTTTSTQEDAETPFQQLMNRGQHLRQLRLLAMTDELERQQSSSCFMNNTTTLLPIPARTVRRENHNHNNNHMKKMTTATRTQYEEEKKENDDEEPVVNENNQEFFKGIHLSPSESIVHTVISANNNNKKQNNTTTSYNYEETMLDYNSYLMHQRYYDDLKHVDINYIDYGNITTVQKRNPSNIISSSNSSSSSSSSSSSFRKNIHNGVVQDGEGTMDNAVVGMETTTPIITTTKGTRRLIIEQRKRLGKGGLCWDAAFILAEYVIHNQDEWNCIGTTCKDSTTTYCPCRRRSRRTRVVELGAGTGLCGMMITKAITWQCHVEITDLPELQDLIEANLVRNFNCHNREEKNEEEEEDLDFPISMTAAAAECSRHFCSESESESVIGNEKDAHNNNHLIDTIVSRRVLRWGMESDYGHAPYDCIIGADIVTNLYDPIALARTIHALSGLDTRIYISGKARLDKPHEEFEMELQRLFHSVKKIWIDDIPSRLRSPNVFILVAQGKNV